MSVSYKGKTRIDIYQMKTNSNLKMGCMKAGITTRGLAVPKSLRNLKAELTESSASTSLNASNTNTVSCLVSDTKERNSHRVLLENTSKSCHPAPSKTFVRSQSQLNSQEQPCDQDQKEQKKQKHQDNSLPHTLCQTFVQPLWTERFAEDIAKSVKRAMHKITSEGNLLHTARRKCWSLTHNDILSLSSPDDGEGYVLGSGSFSKVTKVRIKGNKKSIFALKRLKGDLLPSKLTPNSCKNGSVFAFTKAAIELAREVFLLSRFDHPHIINIMGWTEGGVTSYSKYRTHDAYFLVLELLKDETLDDRIEKWNQDDTHFQAMSCSQEKIKKHFHQRKIEQLTICKHIASALAYIHSKNVVYRDLKPQNIGFARNVDSNNCCSEENFVVKLMDFGLARELPLEGILTSQSSLPAQQKRFCSHTNKNPFLFDMTGTVGTIRYMAPEVFLNRPYGLECDIYSWSIIAHEIFSQNKPYNDMTPDMYQSMVCKQGIRPPTHDMPSELIVLLTQAWRTEPSKRLPFNRIHRQLDLLLQQEKLTWESKLLSGMPEKHMSPLFESFSYDSMCTQYTNNPGIGRRGQGRNKRSWCQANDDDRISGETSQINAIFPNASMDCHVENHAMYSYNNSHDCNTATNISDAFMYEQSPQLHVPVTPDRYCTRHRQLSQKRSIPGKHSDSNHHYNKYYYNPY